VDPSSILPDSGLDPLDLASTLEDYGNLQLGDNGDLYAALSTPDKFSVVKWAWQPSATDKTGGPDAPIGLGAISSSTNVKLAWTLSLQDPGCVTGYEIVSGTTAGGPYSSVATVKAGVKHYTDTMVERSSTYYYQVKALSAMESSASKEVVTTTGQ